MEGPPEEVAEVEARITQQKDELVIMNLLSWLLVNTLSHCTTTYAVTKVMEAVVKYVIFW